MRRTLFVMTLVAAFVLLGGGLAFAQASAPPATWSVTDCQGCHEKALGPGFTHTKHASLDQSCAKCHQNVGEHAKAQMAGEKGPVPSLKGLKASEINATCLTLPREGRPGQLPQQHARAPQRRLHVVPQRARLQVVEGPAEDRDRLGDVLHVPQDRAREVDAHVAPPGARRQDGLRELPQPARRQRARRCSRPTRSTSSATSATPRSAGPFVFEHAPVREDCVSCHEPHGTNHPRLLTQKLPNLCWNCHISGSGHFPPGDNAMTEKGVHGRPGRSAERLPGRSGALRRAELPELPRQDPRLQPPVRRLLCEVTHEAND